MNKTIFWKVFSVTTIVLIAFVISIIINCIDFGTDISSNLEILDKHHRGEPKNILVMGTDLGGLRSDVMMIYSISPKGKTVNSVSIPRDTRIKSGNSYMKLNSALAVGGDEFAIKKIKEVTGIPIHEYVKLNFQAVVDIVDALGGVKFDVPQNMKYNDPYQDLYIDIDKGLQTLDGEKALQLLRFRSYPMGDLARIEVQQQFIKEMFDQKAKLRYLPKASSLYKAVQKNVSTSLTKSETVSLARKILSYEIVTLELPSHLSPSGTYILINDDIDEFVNTYFKKTK